MAFILTDVVRVLTVAVLTDTVFTTIPGALKDIAAIMKKCCDAIYYAHKEHKIIHRDIKPSNIMMDRKEPKIMDFGLAKEMDRDEQLSHGGGMMGTLG